jgi:hypothetical protein
MAYSTEDSSIKEPSSESVSLRYKVVNVDVANTNSSDYIYIGRSRQYGGPTKWGNPYKIGKDGSRDEVVAKHKSWLLSDTEFKHENFPFSNKQLRNQIHELKGKNLGCHCAPLPCHGDILIRLANGFKCFYCDVILSSDVERAKHRRAEHPECLLDWPTQDDFAHRMER